MAFDLPAAVRAGIDAGGDGHALAYGGRWRSWRWLADVAHAIDDAAGEARVVGLVARNRPQHVAAFASGIMARRTTAMIYSAQSTTALAAEIMRLKLPAILAEPQDWTEVTLAAAEQAGTAAIAITDADPADSVRILASGAANRAHDLAGRAVWLLSSGTTGAPKRLPLSWESIAAAVASAQVAYAGTGATQAPQVMVHPLGNVAGLGYALPPLANSQRLVLLDKFDAVQWAQAVRDYRPARGTVPPVGIRMLLDGDIPPDWLSSLSLVAVGGGKLDPELQDAFEAHFGIPVLTAFGATEFGGVIASWSLDAYRQLGAAKRGSAGKMNAGVELRAVDPESHMVLAAGEIGLLEAKVARIGPDWIRTNDLASIDDDGFLYLHGRADGAINRGGFKIVPDQVAAVLKTHPAVADAAVIGLSDSRLGEVPVAAVEIRPGQTIDEMTLKAWARDHLLAYQLPTRLFIVEALPRNASMKVSLPEVRALFI